MITEYQLQQAIDNAPRELKELIKILSEALDNDDYATAYGCSTQISMGIVRIEAGKELLKLNT